MINEMQMHLWNNTKYNLNAWGVKVATLLRQMVVTQGLKSQEESEWQQLHEMSKKLF